jgi:hypothetical protein
MEYKTDDEQEMVCLFLFSGRKRQEKILFVSNVEQTSVKTFPDRHKKKPFYKRALWFYS